MKRLLAAALALGGCGKDPDSGIDTAAMFCADAPTVTWESHGQALVTEHCQACHATTSPDRKGAPENVTFDTEDDCYAHSDAILRVIDAEAPTMPPGYDLSSVDIELVTVWLICWAE